ncbi:MAG: response regulator [Thermoflexales bacterium]|nr:response regulator [Thermoflexales bacterium]
MSKPLHVLIVEDSESDADLVVRLLRKASYDVRAERADNAGQMRAALEKQAWDVVIADYRLPQFDAPTALALLQQTGLDIPFIVISGAIGEDAAVAMMKAGAHDYLMKDKLSRLAPAVEREIREAQTRLERKRAVEALRESERQLREAQALGRIGNWEYDLQSGAIQWSDQVYALYERDPALGPPTAEEETAYYSLEQARLLREYSHRAAEEGQSFEYDIKAALPSGRTAHFSATMRPVRDEKGRVAKLFGTVQDVTQRKQAEEASARASQEWQTTFDATNDAIWILSLDQRVLRSNKAVGRILGRASEEVIGKHCWEIVHGTAEPIPKCPILRAKANLRRETMDMQIGESWVQITVDPILDAAGRYAGAVHIISDITKRKQAEMELERRAEQLAQLSAELEAERNLLAWRVEERTAELHVINEDLLKAARAKDEFLASMSHELRTPLNAILSISEALQEQIFGALSEKQLVFLHTIEDSGRHLLALINDILDLSKAEAGKLEVQPGPVSIGPLCQASLQFVRQTAYEKQIELTLNLDSRAATVEADERRLKQILVNLLSNAVKFTPRGGAVGLDVKADVEQSVLHLSVWDTGIGIARQDLGRLFEPFVQLDSRLSRQYSGTGLGLSLVRRLVELHGGSVSVESEPGKGSRFTVSIPWREGDKVTRASGQGDVLASQALVTRDSGQGELARYRVSPGHPVTVLLAEDNEANIDATSDYLQAKGYRVILARNGNEAVQLAEENRPDVIVMDIQMPGMDGLEAIRRICALPPLYPPHKRGGGKGRPLAATEGRIGGGPPIIALTALAMPGDRERCLAAGANEYMSKPVSLKRLVATIENCLLCAEDHREC